MLMQIGNEMKHSNTCKCLFFFVRLERRGYLFADRNRRIPWGR